MSLDTSLNLRISLTTKHKEPPALECREKNIIDEKKLKER